MDGLREGEGVVSSPVFQGRSLNLQAFEPAQNGSDQGRGQGYLRLLSVLLRGDIQTRYRTSQAPLQADIGRQHLVQPSQCVLAAYQIWSHIPCCLFKRKYNNIY